MIATALRYLNEELGLKIIDIARSVSDASIFLTEDGNVYSCGNDHLGVTGLGKTTGTSTAIPTRIPTLSNIKQICSTGYAMFALTNTGQIWMWGSAGFSNTPTLPGKGTGAVLTPVELDQATYSMPPIAEITSGSGRVYALVGDGTFYGWGGNSGGVVAINSTNSQINAPTISPVTGVKTVLGNGNGTVVLKNDGTVWYVAGNSQIFGVGNANSTNSLVVLNDKISNIKDISFGNQCVIYLTNDNKLYYSGSQANMGITNPVMELLPKLIYTGGEKEIKLGPKRFANGFSSGIIFLEGTELVIVGNSIYQDASLTGIPSPPLGQFVKLTSFTNIDKFFSDSAANFITTTPGLTYAVGKNVVGGLGLGSDYTTTPITSYTKTVALK